MVRTGAASDAIELIVVDLDRRQITGPLGTSLHDRRESVRNKGRNRTRFVRPELGKSAVPVTAVCERSKYFTAPSRLEALPASS
jgi:hypothetical protein